eukprot:TRINITY_DN71194_c0_g1_i1.p2 TRINITY_DN71194_c0_g1~~TRINITY_DN71194_c0_g1_i1.p2  ORF type:complete len:137 (+),score=33.55 TRINITY_DN71194_c0_g1_i1:90-500(+)
MSSGIIIPDDTKAKYAELQANHKWHYLFFEITKDNELVAVGDLSLAKEGKDDEFDFPEFHNKLTKDNTVSIAVADYKGKVFLVTYAPDSCGVRAKMLLASGTGVIKSEFNIEKWHVHGSSEDEVDEGAFQAKLGSK